MTSTKPVVRYWSNTMSFLSNGCAVLFPVDHPSQFVSNKKFVVTSLVVKVGEDGEFETENTIYRPYEYERTQGLFISNQN